MKKSLLVALALSFFAAPVVTALDASAQTRQQVQELRQDKRELRDDKRDVRQGKREVRQDRREIRQSRRPAWMKQGGRYQRGGTRVSDYKRYGLRAPGRNQRWVKVDDTYILVGITSGVIASIIAGR